LTIGSDGIKGFMNKVHDAFVEMQDKGKAVNYGVVKKSVLAIAPLDKNDKLEKLQLIGSEIRGRVTFSPQPNDPNGPLEIDNYLIPDKPKYIVPGAPEYQENRTEAQLGDDFYNYYSPRALAMRAAAMEFKITIDPSIQRPAVYSDNFAVGVVVDGHGYAGKIQAEALSKTVFKDGFGVMTLPSKFNRPTDVQKDILSVSDGVVFAFDPEKAKEEFWRNVYMFTSMVVAEQTHDKLKVTKPFYLVNPNGEFNYLVDMVTDFHHSGTVVENPSTLYKQVKTMDEAVERLKEDRKTYRRFLLPEYATQKHPFDVVGRRTSKLKKDFNVAIFCSATNKNETYVDAARKFTDDLIDEDFGIVSGAGMHAMMGAATDAAFIKRKDPWNAEHSGSSTPTIMPGEGNGSKIVTQFQLARNIYERMEYMMDRSDAFAVMVGGTGTMQEFALLCLLKKRALEMGDSYSKAKMAEKEIVVINTPMENGEGFYDKLKEMIHTNDPKAFEQLGIHFVESKEAAMEKMRELRESKRTRTGWVAPEGYVGLYASSNNHGLGSAASH